MNLASLSPLTARLRPDRFTLLVAAIALLGVALVLARQIRYGPAIGFDSVQYIYGARSILEGNGLTLWGGSPFVLHPPFYPAALAGASLGVLDPADVAAPLNAAVFGLIIFIIGKWMGHRGASKPLAAWVCLAIAFAAPITRFVSEVLSESFFILFTTIAFIQTDNYIKTSKQSSLLWAGAFSGLAWLTRYMGVAAFLVIAAFLVYQPGIKLSEKAKRAALYCVVSATPIALWVTRNILKAGSPTGDRRSGDYAIPDIFVEVLQVIGVWILPTAPEFIHRFAAPFAAGGLLAALAVGVFRVLARNRRSGDWSDRALFALFGAFALTFIIAHTSLILYRNPHGIQERHFIPAYIPIALAAVLVLDNLFKRAQSSGLWGRLGNLAAVKKVAGGRTINIAGASVALGLTLFLWLSCNAALTADHIRDNNSGVSIGYSAPRWAESDLMRHLQETPPQALVSNAPYAVYAYTEKTAQALGFYVGEDAISQNIADYGDGTSIAFFDGDYPYPYSMSYLRGRAGVETIANFKDGILLRVNGNAKSAFPARWEALEGVEPVIRSVYDLYLRERTLIYAKSPCNREDTAAQFFLHVTPVDAASLPDERGAIGFDNFDFRFERYGVRFGEACLASVALPAYPIETIRTGQFSGGKRLWEANFPSLQ